MLAVSEKRRIAARINGAKSRGPRTPEGKARSCRNATRHGLLSKLAPVLDDDARAAWQQLLDEYLQDLRPKTKVERSLVEQMATFMWQFDRANVLENQALASQMQRHRRGSYVDRLTGAFDVLAAYRPFQLLLRYQSKALLAHSRILEAFCRNRANSGDTSNRKLGPNQQDPRASSASEPTPNPLVPPIVFCRPPHAPIAKDASLPFGSGPHSPTPNPGAQPIQSRCFRPFNT